MRKTLCKAFTSKGQKCSQVGHFSKFCKKTPDKKTKEEPVKANTVLVMHSTVETAGSNLCQFRAQVKADIEADVKKGILERVPAGEHDTWYSRMVIQSKKIGKVRRTVDLSYLSKHVLDESHHTPSDTVIAKRGPGNKYKSTLDCMDGYHGFE